MIDERGLQPLSERRSLQPWYGTDALPLQNLRSATYTTNAGERLIVDVLRINAEETLALLSYEEPGKQRSIWHAERDQSGRPGTWLWTPEQLEDARHNPQRISEEGQQFESASYETASERRQSEILQLGILLGKSREEIQAQLRAEGLDGTWIDDDEISSLHTAELSTERRTDQLRLSTPALHFSRKRPKHRRRR